MVFPLTAFKAAAVKLSVVSDGSMSSGQALTLPPGHLGKNKQTQNLKKHTHTNSLMQTNLYLVLCAWHYAELSLWITLSPSEL